MQRDTRNVVINKRVHWIYITHLQRGLEDHIYWKTNQTNHKLACVASVSVRFRSKERGTRVKDRAKISRANKTENPPSTVSFGSETKRKRLLRRLITNRI